MEIIAAERMHGSDASLREKIDAALVRADMKCKRILGKCISSIVIYSIFISNEPIKNLES